MDDSERARLIERNLDIPQRAAKLCWGRVAGYVEFDELVSLGNAGLAQAAQRFDPDKGAAFTTYAWYRVHGAILDGLRKIAAVPRREWAKLKTMGAAADYLEVRTERERGATLRGAAPPRGADALRAMRDAMAAVRTMYAVSLDSIDDAHAAAPEERADDKLDAARLSRRLAAAIAKLPKRERELMRLHYWEGKNLLEAGEKLGLSKSWASRLHAQVIDQLRDLVEDATAPP